MNFTEERMIGKQPRSVAHRKPLGDRPWQGWQDEPGDVKNHPDRKLQVGLVLLLGRDAGQRDVWDASVHEGMCEEVWQIHEQLNHEMVYLCFLVIARDRKGPHQSRDTL